MEKQKMEIKSHTFKGATSDGKGNLNAFTYEITFNRSLETTCRMDAMTRGMDRFDKWKKFWFIVYAISPFKKLTKYAYQRF